MHSEGSVSVRAEERSGTTPQCRDGAPDHGEYGELLAMVESPGFLRQDQWQVQIPAQVELKADACARSSHLDGATIQQALLCACSSIEDTVSSLLERNGLDATICGLPDGPMTIPYVAP
jgi:hypothetical protein